ncbi:MAG: radical SAM protein [Candidatus Eisenbacteria bacterium]
MRVALAYPMIKRDAMACNPPLGILYLATSLQKHGHEVAAFDRDGYDGGLQELISRVSDYKPELVGLPLFSGVGSFRDVQVVVKQVREKLPTAHMVLGGPHASACPEQTLQWYPEVDFVLRGEAEHTVCALAAQLEKNVARPEVPGLCYREGGEIVSIPLGKFTADLDSIPIPDRKFLWENYRRKLYWRLDRKGVTDYIVTGRGCPFRCKFCYQLERSTYRLRSPENILQEIMYLASLGTTCIDFEDDIFTADKSRSIRVCRMIREAGLRLDLKVRSHVNTVDEELLAELRAAGARTVVFGIESGSQKILDAMNKKATVERNAEAIRLTKKAGLACYADMFIGFPGETLETMAETERFLAKTKPTAINMQVLVPFPGTAIYAESKANGTLVGDWSIDKPTPFVKLPWADNREILWAHQRRIVRRYYSGASVLLEIQSNCLGVWVPP